MNRSLPLIRPLPGQISDALIKRDRPSNKCTISDALIETVHLIRAHLHCRKGGLIKGRLLYMHMIF